MSGLKGKDFRVSSAKMTANEFIKIVFDKVVVAAVEKKKEDEDKERRRRREKKERGVRVGKAGRRR